MPTVINNPPPTQVTQSDDGLGAGVIIGIILAIFIAIFFLAYCGLPILQRGTDINIQTPAQNQPVQSQPIQNEVQNQMPQNSANQTY